MSNSMKVGDTVQIKGWFGFLMNPQVTVIEETENLVKVILTDRIGEDKGVLSHLNGSWHSKESLASRI